MLQKSTILLLTFILLLFAEVVAQNADCADLLILEDTIYHTKEITGFGAVREFKGNRLEDKKLFEKEENSIWYLISMPDSGVFTFDIVTENKKDDWDFLLYKNEKMFCRKLADKVITPIRSNLSRSSTTGISIAAEERFVSSGINNSYSKAVRVKKGEQYVLVVNNPKTVGRKHSLVLHLPKPKKVILHNPQPVNTTVFNLEFKDASSKKTTKAAANVFGLSKKVLELNFVANFKDTIAKKNRKVTVEAYAKGYMLLSKAYKVSKSRSKFTAEVLLEKIEPGKRVNLAKIQFYGDQYSLLPSAKPSLKSLLLFMKLNPSVVIEVEGHVNGPGQRNSRSYKELSSNRALAVKKYLIKNGIVKERVNFHGYGNSQMLFPKPKSKQQESANRRVEIKILSK